jgi:hypothetical protein
MRQSFVQSLKRHWLALMAACGILAVAVAVLVVFWPDSLEERVKRIQPGMTPADVEEVMGVPSGDYGYYPRAKVQRGGIDPDADWNQAWTWDNASVVVWFNPAGQATRAEYKPHPLSLSDHWRHWVDQ